MASDQKAVAVPLAEGLDHGIVEWEAATAAVLRKSRRLADDAPDSESWAALAATTLDGITVAPLGTPALSAELPEAGLPGQAPFTRGAMANRELDGWDIRAWFTDPDVDRTSADVVTDLENGVNSLWLTLGDAGVPIDALPRVLEPVFIDLAPVVVSCADDPLGAARALAAVIDDKAVTAHPACNLGLTDVAHAVEGVQLAQSLGIRAFVVDATAAHDRGASEVQELAYALLRGAAYLRELEVGGIDATTAAGFVEFRFAATDEQFTTIAKLRAARRLWHRVLELSGADTVTGQHQHAVTSRPMLSTYDPYVNMLRTTVAAFAAGVGGAEAVTVLPFDEPLGLPEPFSRRIARNTSSLLIAESHVAAVIDPAGGAHAVEKLTDDLARAGWALFGELDAAADVDQLLEQQIAETIAARTAQIARRTRPVTGLSEFPNLQEERPQRRPYAVAPQVRRYGADFEALRDTPATAPVFLATMGSVAAHTARASFAANLFASGGVDIVTAGATDGVDDVLTAYEDAGRPAVVMLAGADRLYTEWGADLIAALRKAGARCVLLAGRSESLDVDGSAAVGDDALAFLRRTREELGA